MIFLDAVIVGASFVIGYMLAAKVRNILPFFEYFRYALVYGVFPLFL